MKVKIKVLLAKLGLDIHNRGVLFVAKNLRDAGMEVIYIGNSTPEQIINATIQEDADVVGVSSLGGAHMSLGAKVLSLAREEGIAEGRIYLMGGAVPEEDKEKLTKAGFDAIFTSGATSDEMVSYIEKIVKRKK